MFFRICVSVCIGVGIVLWIVFFVPQTKDNTVSVPSISIDNTSETPQKIIADWLVRVMRTDNYQNWNLYPTELETYNWLHVYKGRIDNISWSWVVIDDIFFSTTRSKNINFSALMSLKLSYGTQETSFCEYPQQVDWFSNDSWKLLFPSVQYTLEKDQSLYFCVTVHWTKDFVYNYHPKEVLDIWRVALDWDPSSTIYFDGVDSGTWRVEIDEDIYNNMSFRNVWNVWYSGEPLPYEERRISYAKGKDYWIYLWSFDITSEHENPVRVDQFDYVITMWSVEDNDIYPVDADIKLVVDDYAYIYPPIKITRSWENNATHFTRFTLDPQETKRIDFYIVPKWYSGVWINRKIRISPRNAKWRDLVEKKSVAWLTYWWGVLMNISLWQTIIIE